MLFNLKEKPCKENANNLKPRSCVDHLKNGADKCGHYKIYDAAGNGFTVYCDMETESGAAWTLVTSWSFKNKLFSNFRYFLNVLKALCKFNYTTGPVTALNFPVTTVEHGSRCDHSSKRPVLVTITFVKPSLNCDLNFVMKSSRKRPLP